MAKLIHTMIRVMDLKRAAQFYERYTVGDIKDLPGGAARFYFATDPDGYKIEVLERAGHYV